MTELLEWSGERVLSYGVEEPRIDGERQAVELIGDALSNHATIIVVPVNRLSAAFFDLRSGVAGAIAQKIVTYHLKLAIIGDIAAHVAASQALRDWVQECNRGAEIWFLPSIDDLKARLGGPRPRR